MTRSSEWQETQQLEPRAANTAKEADSATDGSPDDTPEASDFASTELHPRDDDEIDSRLWAEAADGQCSDEAAQFAASQPAPLSIV